MEKIVLSLVLVCLFAGVVLAGDYTVTLTARQEAGLSYAVTQFNAGLKEGETPTTNAKYLADAVKSICKDYYNQSYAARIETLKQTLVADPTKLDSIEAAVK